MLSAAPRSPLPAPLTREPDTDPSDPSARARYYDPRFLALLASELERSYSLSELHALSHSLLGPELDAAASSQSVASLAQAVVRACVRRDAVLALIDTLQLERVALPAGLQLSCPDDYLVAPRFRPAQLLGDYEIVSELDRTSLYATYLAQRTGNQYRLRVLAQSAAESATGMARLGVYSRHLQRHPIAGVETIAIERCEGLAVLVSPFARGRLLSEHLKEAGPLVPAEASALAQQLLQMLEALHAAGLVHGQLGTDTVLLQDTGDGADKYQLILLSAGQHLLCSGRLSSAALHGLCPEVLGGANPTPASDVYAFASVLCEIATGRGPFEATTLEELRLAHGQRSPAPLGSLDLRPVFSSALEGLVARCLSRVPALRPRDAATLHAELTRASGVVEVTPHALAAGEVDHHVQALRADPTQPEALTRLLGSVERGASASEVAQVLWQSWESLESGDQATSTQSYQLLLRASELWEGPARDPLRAQAAYEVLLRHWPDDAVVLSRACELYRRTEQHEALVDLLLRRQELAEMPAQAAELWLQAAQVYEHQLDDPEQALVAHAEAFCCCPGKSRYRRLLEQAAGNRHEAWTEVVAVCSERLTRLAADAPERVQILERVGYWHLHKLSQHLPALGCFEAILALEPGHPDAMQGLLKLYRRTQQYTHLGRVLMMLAECPGTTTLQRRRYLNEAADLLAKPMKNPAAAAELYETILAEDPENERAREALLGLLGARGLDERCCEVLERAARALTGNRRSELLCRAARLCEERQGDLTSALEHYAAALRETPAHPEALTALERLLLGSGRSQELLASLHDQCAHELSQRQRIRLWECIARVHERESAFAAAAHAYQQILSLDRASDAALCGLERVLRRQAEWHALLGVYEQHLLSIDHETRANALFLALVRLLARELGQPQTALERLQQQLRVSPASELLRELVDLALMLGQVAVAVTALDELAERTNDSGERASHWLNAGHLLQEHDCFEEAIDYYKRALAFDATQSIAAEALTRAYLELGNYAAASSCMKLRLELMQNGALKAKLWAELARLDYEQLQNSLSAQASASQALALDPTSIDAHYVLGMLAFEADDHAQASDHLEHVVAQAQRFSRTRAIGLMTALMQALARTDRTQRALEVGERLLDLAPNDRQALQAVAEIEFSHGSPQRSRDLNRVLCERFSTELTIGDRALVLARLGRAALETDSLDEAIAALEQTLSLDPGSYDAARDLITCHERAGHWAQALEGMRQLLTHVAEGERQPWLLRMGALAADKLNQPESAIESYRAALAIDPGDREALSRLLPLFTQTKAWNELVAAHLGLAQLAADQPTKAQHLYRAARVLWDELKGAERAQALLDEALTLAPALEAGLQLALSLARAKPDPQRLRALFLREIQSARAKLDIARAASAFEELGDLYRFQLREVEQAVASYRGALQLDPANSPLQAKLGELYAEHADTYPAQALEAQYQRLQLEPRDSSAYKLLRKLFTRIKRADRAWCACQALMTLGAADTEEQAFFERHRSREPLRVQHRLELGEWKTLLLHPDSNPVITDLFAVIHQAVFRTHGRPMQQLGYESYHQLDPKAHATPVLNGLRNAAETLNVELPPLFVDRNFPGTLQYAAGQPPACVVGRAALLEGLAPREAAFVAGSMLTRYLPGASARHLLHPGVRLRAWLFAAIASANAQFQIPEELKAEATPAQVALERSLSEAQVLQLAKLVNRLLSQQLSLDLERWAAGLDFTADRVGFLFANDLDVALGQIRRAVPTAREISAKARSDELIRYSVSEQYFKVRERLAVPLK